MTEKQLVKKAAQGDKQAFAQLYGLYKDRLYRYAFYRLGNCDDAQDAVCDTFLSAYEQIGKLRKASAFPSWIFKIHSTACNKYITLQANARENSELSAFENSEKLSKNFNTLSLELQECLNILNEQEKEIVLLSVVAGLNSKEISRLTGLADGSVRSKLSRSLAKMRAFLE